jgi:lipopolysaccharide export system permease protein
MSAATAGRVFATRSSATLDYYVGRAYLMRFLILLVGVSLVLQVLDLLSNSGDIMAAPGATYDSVLKYIRLRWPQLISEFTPFTGLLAALMTYTTLNQHSEIVIMKASGMAPWRIVLPLIVASFAIAVMHFIFNESVVVQSSAKLKYWQEHNYAVDLSAPPKGSTRTWVLDNNNFIEVKAVTRNGPLLVIDELTVYERDMNGQLTGVLKADFGVFKDQEWTLFDARHFNTQNLEVASEERTAWTTGIPPERFLALAISPTDVSFGELWSAIVRLEKEGYPIRYLSASLHHKIAAPLATMLMPLLAAIAAFGVLRSGQLFIRAAIALAFGFAYFIVDNLLLAMGQFGRMPPSLSAWAPLFLFLTAGLLVLVYSEE